MNTFWNILAVLGVLVLYVIFTYNTLVRIRNRVKEAWADIDVQLKRRHNLIPNLVNTVKGYMAHESGVLEKVTEARTRAMGVGGSSATREEAENTLTGALKTLFAVSENYPDLKASANFVELQRELTDTEDKIQAARRFYNGNVRDLNTQVESFPSNLVARIFGFKHEHLFKIEVEGEKDLPVVDF